MDNVGELVVRSVDPMRINGEHISRLKGSDETYTPKPYTSFITVELPIVAVGTKILLFILQYPLSGKSDLASVRGEDELHIVVGEDCGHELIKSLEHGSLSKS